MNDFPDVTAVLSQKEYTYNRITQPNRNGLLWTNPEVDGIKTGFTEAAGYNLVATAKKGDTRLVAAVMGASGEKAREAEANKLLTLGFETYSTVLAARKGEPVGTARVWKGRAASVGLVAAGDAALTVERGKESSVEKRVEARKGLVAPVSKGQVIGELVVSSGADERRVPVEASGDVGRAGFWRSFVDSVKLLMLRAFRRL